MPAEPEQLTPEQVDEYWTRLAQMKKQFEAFAKSYIKTLEQFRPDAPNPQQKKIVENVRSYLYVFLKLCADTRDNPKRSPSLKALDGCEKTLQAVWKRAARKRSASGSKAHAGTLALEPMLPEKMTKWGFLVKHDRWLAVEGYSLTVFSRAPEPNVKPTADVEMMFNLSDCFCTKETAESPLAFSLTQPQGGRAIFLAESQEQFDRWWARISCVVGPGRAGTKRPRPNGKGPGAGAGARPAGAGAVGMLGGGGGVVAPAPTAPPPSVPPPSAPPPSAPPPSAPPPSGPPTANGSTAAALPPPTGAAPPPQAPPP